MKWELREQNAVRSEYAADRHILCVDRRVQHHVRCRFLLYQKIVEDLPLIQIGNSSFLVEKSDQDALVWADTLLDGR
jgi:hypothetical protein